MANLNAILVFQPYDLDLDYTVLGIIMEDRSTITCATVNETVRTHTYKKLTILVFTIYQNLQCLCLQIAMFTNLRQDQK